MPVARKRRPKSKPALLSAPSLARYDWMVHGFSTRSGGFSSAYGKNTLNLGFTAHDPRPIVVRNRKAFLASLARPSRTDQWQLITHRQIHSDLIHLISEPMAHPIAGDGLITATPGLLLAVLTADCLPVIIADPKHRAVGVFHAGWRGTAKRIVEKGVGEMRKHLASVPARLRAAIGPGIRSCCYQVGEEVRNTFDAQFSYGPELFRATKERDEIHQKYPLLFLTA